MIAVFFNFDLVLSGSEVNGVIGGSGKVIVNVDLSALGKRVGGKKTSSFS